ncbi:MAG: response regulator [Elusimicrobia bacterium]|nr:response regulator [Elusimicrobiota bacterium]
MTKILLADPDIDRRFKIKLILRRYDCEFREARNFEVADRILKMEKLDLCVVDYLLPGRQNLNIYDVCQKIIAKFSVPIIVLFPEGINVEKTHGGAVYLPFPKSARDEGELVAKMEFLLGKKLKPRKFDEKFEKRELKKILIADDEYAVRVLLKTLLKNYEICEAKDGIELREKAVEFKPDLIITDVIMPGISAWKAIKELREMSEFKDIPVIFASGYVKDKEIFEMHRPAGPSAFLLKPFKKDELFGILKNFFVF